ncbi:hypothetical protein AB0J80_08580 [Actinoplanes sp. NPDC049548]|uniref:hypothetical protein n=1 Tax=Actinoplanes sp. NPDC049548 TaxID=3155152 RepID=UPI003424C482
MRAVRLVAGLLIVVGIVTGCASPDTSPIESGIPNPSRSAVIRSLPAPGGHWKGLRSKCPQLTSSAARRIGAGGAGTPTDDYAATSIVTNADCQWGSTDGRGAAVNARINIWARQEAADAEWRTLSTDQTESIQVGDVGFVMDEGRGIVVRTRWGNAVATVRLVAADETGRTQLSDAGDIADDVLDDLVPG